MAQRARIVLAAADGEANTAIAARVVRELNARIRAYIDGWNDRAHPFTWAKTADQILAKANRKKTSRVEQ